MREAMLRVGAGGPAAGPGYVQLLEPLAPDTPVGKFLARRGEGIHHVGYGVTDISAAMSAIGATGVRLSMSGRGTGRWARPSPSCTRPIWAAC